MFGAPDLPRRQPRARKRADRHSGVGDHVDFCGGYAGLIVDIDENGRAIVACRSAFGVTESALAVSALTKSASVPLGFDERIDPEWKRLG